MSKHGKYYKPKDANLIVSEQLRNIAGKDAADIREDGESAFSEDDLQRISTSVYRVQKLVEGEFENIGSVPVTPNLKISDEIEENKDWGGPGEYRVELYDHEGRRIPGLKTIGIVIPGNKKEEEEKKVEEKESSSTRSLKEAENELERKRLEIEGLRMERVKSELRRDIKDFDGEDEEEEKPAMPEFPSIEEIEERVGKKNENLAVMMLQNQQQMMMMMINRQPKPDQSIGNAIAKAIEALPSILAIMKPAERPAQPSQLEQILPQILPELLRKAMEKPSAPDPMVYLGPILQATTQTMQESTRSSIESMNKIHEMQMQVQVGDAGLQKLQTVANIIQTTLAKPIADLASAYLASRQLPAPLAPQAPKPANQALPAPTQTPAIPEQSEEQVLQGIVFEVTDKLGKSQDPNEIFGYLIKKYDSGLLKRMATNKGLTDAIPTIPEPHRGNLEKILKAINEY